MRKSLVIVHMRDTWEDEIPLKDSPKTRESFEEFFHMAHAEDIEPYRASIHWYNSDAGCFEKAWTFHNGKWSKQEKKIFPDFVFDKIAGKHDYRLFDLKMKLAERHVIFNHPLFRSMFDNKLAQYVAFGEFMPTSLLATDSQSLERAIKKIKTTDVVLKPLYGSGGNGIFIGKKDDALLNSALIYPLLVQEFIETGGVPGVSSHSEVADLRIVYVNHHPAYALSRIARHASLFTNLHQGATAKTVSLEEIPAACQKIAQSVVEKLSIFSHTNYSLDFMFTNNGDPLLIEMNTTPGLDLLLVVGTPELRKQYFHQLFSMLKEQ